MLKREHTREKKRKIEREIEGMEGEKESKKEKWISNERERELEIV